MIVQQEESLGNSAPDLLLTTQSKLTAGVLRAPNNAQSLPKPCNLCFSIFHKIICMQTMQPVIKPPTLWLVDDDLLNLLSCSQSGCRPTRVACYPPPPTSTMTREHQDGPWSFFLLYFLSLLAVHPFRRLPLPRENRISVLCPAGNRKLPAETLSSASLRRITSRLLEDNVFLLLFSTPKFGISWCHIAL